MANNEPIKHHYIPQFILKIFNDENGQLNYWNINDSRLEKRNSLSVFMIKNMYRDEINHTENPVIIENQFSYFEDEIARLINDKILINSNKIILTRSELEKFRIFLTLFSFRSNFIMKQYEENNFDDATRAILLKYQQDSNFKDLWKKELYELTLCRTYDDIKNNDKIDHIIKQDFLNDYEGYYISFADARGGEFLLSDIYPTSELYPFPQPFGVHLHYLFPLSPTRILILNHIMFKKEYKNTSEFVEMLKVSKIKDYIPEPKVKYKVSQLIHDPKDEFSYNCIKVYSSDVAYLNCLILNEARTGIVFKNKGKIEESVNKYNSLSNTNNNLREFENCLK